MQSLFIPFLLTLIAGLCTGVGSIISFLYKGDQKKFLSLGLGFSAGVMIYVSMVEIFQKAYHSLSLDHGEKHGMLLTMVGFFGGMFLIAIIDFFIPNEKNIHELSPISFKSGEITEKKQLFRTGIFTALAIAIHNFPEGLATFIAAIHEPELAIPIVAAIAIHNIPEGIAVSVPIYSATGDAKKAFFYSFLSGLAEPIGAILGYMVLMPFMTDTVFGLLFASVAGIMVFISIDELLPAAEKYGEHHLSIYGLVSGMFLMGISLWMFL